MMCETEPLSFDPAKFTRYLTRNITYLLALVPPSPSPLPTDLCTQALHTLSFALHTPDAWSETRALLLTLAPKLEQAGLRDEWIPYLQKGVVQAETLGDDGAAGELHLHLGYLLQLRNNYQAAHDSFMAAAAFAESGDREQQARALNRLAFLARLHPAVGDPVTLAQEALASLPPAHPERAASYVVLGWRAYDRRDWPDAVAYFEQALAIAQQQGNERQLARRLRDLAAAWQMQGKYSAALASYAEAIRRFAAIDDAYDQAVARMNLGVVHLVLGDAHAALTCFTPAEAVFLRVQDQLHLAMLYNNCGIALRLLGQWSEAEQAFLRSLALNEQVDNHLELINVTDELALTYLQQGKVALALRYLRQALDRLPQIAANPAYSYWQAKVTAHWQAALAATNATSPVTAARTD